MTALDAVLLLCAVAAALIAVWSRRPPPRRLALGVGAALAALVTAQLALEGLLLRFAPVWLLIGVFALVAVRPPRSRSGRWTLRAAAVLLCGAAVLTWLVAPAVPSLPRPTGPHAVGAHVFRWTDASRPEAARPGERRSVIAQLWYPAAPGGGRAPPYIDGLGRLPASVAGLPGRLMGAYGRIDVHARGDAPLAADRPRWPLVVFSPGAEATRAFYSGLAVELASRGWAVAVLDHPYESAVVQLADGRLVLNAHRFNQVAGDEARASAFMAAEQRVRAADLAFTLDQLGREPGWRERLALDRVTAAGHSFGGASAIELWTREPRVADAVNLDGTLYGDPAADHPRPGRIVVVQSDEALTRHVGRYAEGLARLTRGLGRAPEVVVVPGASHISFTDAPAFVGWPVRLALPELFGRRSAAEVQRLAADQIAAVAGSH